MKQFLWALVLWVPFTGFALDFDANMEGIYHAEFGCISPQGCAWSGGARIAVINTPESMAGLTLSVQHAQHDFKIYALGATRWDETTQILEGDGKRFDSSAEFSFQVNLLRRTFVGELLDLRTGSHYRVTARQMQGLSTVLETKPFPKPMTYSDLEGKYEVRDQHDIGQLQLTPRPLSSESRLFGVWTSPYLHVPFERVTFEPATAQLTLIHYYVPYHAVLKWVLRLTDVTEQGELWTGISLAGGNARLESIELLR